MRPFTVKVPRQWAGINSARVQVYLRDYFIHPLALPADPGPGERAVCLTLSERLVSKLAEGAGEKPAVALRRLASGHVFLPRRALGKRPPHSAEKNLG